MTNHSHRDTGGTESAQRAEFLRDVTYRCARTQGFSEDDAQDCAQETVVRMLEAYGPELEPRTSIRHAQAWLRACARHHVVDYARRLARERQHTIPSPEAVGADESPLAWEVPDGGPTPEGALEHEELWRQVLDALDRLDTLAHCCVVRRCLIGQSVEEIATATHQTQNHVYRILARAGQRLQTMLSEEGLTAADMQYWLPPPERLVTPPPSADDPALKRRQNLTSPRKKRQGETTHEVKTNTAVSATRTARPARLS
jgi:RNA polymerase sigma factor (sigma-70 family)